MKKTLAIVIVAVVAMIADVGMDAQVRYGIVGGFTSSKVDAEAKVSDANVYNVGFAAKIPLGHGFAVQPGAVYQVKGASLDEIGGNPASAHFDTKVGYLEMPVQLQWGPDLILFRPYVLTEPFIGIGINLENDLDSLKSKSFDESTMSRFEYGIALGGGIEFWRLQVSAKYFWNFGSLKDGINDGAIASTVSQAFTEGKSFNGFTISFGLLF